MRLDAQRLDTVADAVGQLTRRFDNYVIVRKVDSLNRRFDDYVTARRGDSSSESYINSIKNSAKKEYAKKYSAWVLGGRKGSEPDRGELSVMGAQAVRMNIDERLGNRGDTSLRGAGRAVAQFIGGTPYRAPKKAPPPKPLSTREFKAASPHGQRSELGRMIKALPDRQDASLSEGVKQVGQFAAKAAKRVGRGVGNFVDRRKIAFNRRELEWAEGGEKDIRAMAKKSKTGGLLGDYVKPGYWAGQAKERKSNIKALEQRIKQRGDSHHR
jgi:hypothetical protein